MITRDAILNMTDHAYSRSAWHGPNLKSSIKNLTLDEALWQIHPDRPCIWKIILHLAYWKFRTLRWITGDRKIAFKREPGGIKDWPVLPEKTDKASLEADIGMLHYYHRRVTQAFKDLPEARLRRENDKINHHFQGLAFHDIYHAGQIRLIRVSYKRLLPSDS